MIEATSSMDREIGAERLESLLDHADDNMILAQRLGEWISNAPELEEDIALGNFALDHLGVARAIYTHVTTIEGEGRTEDDLAMLRTEREFRNLLLVEQPNRDFAHTMVRSLFFDAFQLGLWATLLESDDRTMAGIADRALKEARYHFRHSSAWVIRLGDGISESHDRAQRAVDSLWRYTGEMFEAETAALHDGWRRRIVDVLEEATLELPEDQFQRSGGRQGIHTEHLGHLLAEMQSMQRSYPGLRW